MRNRTFLIRRQRTNVLALGWVKMFQKYRALLFVVLCLPLAGCWQEQQQALERCSAAIPYRGRYTPLAHVETPMTRCMYQAGYLIDYSSARCANVPVPRRSPYCYAPIGIIAGGGFALEMLFHPGPKPPQTNF